MSPSEFWALHPEEFNWQVEARREQVRNHSPGGKLSEAEALEMKDELRRARVAAGYDPE